MLVLRLWRIVFVAVFLYFAALLLVPGAGMIVCGPSTKTNITRMVLWSAQSGLDLYDQQYGAFSVTPASGTVLRMEGALLLTLIGDRGANQPPGPNFLADFPRSSDNSIAGLKWAGNLGPLPQDIRLVDAWGETCYVLLDVDQDGKISHPAIEADPVWLKSAGQEALISRGAFLWSSGPDRDPKTWKDNITSRP